MELQGDAGGANPSYKGYEYQKLVTVWVALALTFGPDSCADEIIVEPASHDDVKARLAVAADAADAKLTVGAEEELHVQIKFKGAGHWSAKDFAAVIDDVPGTGTRGPARRARAKTLLLEGPGKRYLFITNRSVAGALAPGRVSGPADRPDPTFLPTNLKLNAVEKKILSGRFALIEQMTPEETRHRIDALLTTRLHVPAQNLERCVDRLKRLVEDRFLEVSAPLRKADIRKVAEGLGGLPHADSELARYVPPTNRAHADELLTRKGAVLLVGPSGYGKSLTAADIAYQRRHAEPPFKIVKETAGLGGIEEAFAAPGRVLFHLEDPWGQSELAEDTAHRWTSRLAVLIGRATAEKQFVITSRSQIYQEALGDGPSPIWKERTILIDGSVYDAAARRAILHGNLTAKGSWRQDLARQYEARLLRDLRTPLEIRTFTLELIACTPEDADVDRLVDRALSDSRKHVVVELVRGFGEPGVHGAAVLWALLRYSRNLEAGRLRMLRRVVDGLGARRIALDDLADHLAPTQLAVDEQGSYAAHSKVVEALESLFKRHPRVAETALNTAGAAACALAVKDHSWLDELQRIVEGARALNDRNVEVDEQVVEKFDEFLIADLRANSEDPAKFRAAWRAAVRGIGQATAIGKLVQWLERGAPRGKGWHNSRWHAPRTTEQERECLLAADPGMLVARSFVAHVLPWTHENMDADDLLPWLNAFGVSHRKGFLAAGEAVVTADRFVMCADTISEGALYGPAPPYGAVWDQIMRLQSAVEASLLKSREERRQAWQGELDFVEQLAIQEQVEDEGPSAAHFAKGYVRARRRQEGIDWIQGHPRLDIVLPIWADLMKYGSTATTAAELESYFAAAGNDAHLQAEGLRAVGEGRLAFGRDRVFEALTTGTPDLVEASVRALSWLESDGEGRRDPAARAVWFALMKTLPLARAAMIAPMIADIEFGTKKAALAAKLLEACSPSVRPAVHLSLSKALGADDATMLQRFRDLSPGDAETLITDGPPALKGLLLVISAAEGIDIAAVAAAWVKSEDADLARTAVQALGRDRGSAGKALIAAALSHHDYTVRRKAISELATAADEAERARILRLADDRSAPVRAALAETIGRHGWQEGVDILMDLLRDTRDYNRHPERQRRSEPVYQVARTSAEALSAFDTLSSNIIGRIITFVNEGVDSSADVEVHAMLTSLLGEQDEDAVWSVLDQGLNDDRVVGEIEENLYPVRYAAAWAMARRISNRPSEIDRPSWPALEAAADHHDAQFAAPALMALGSRLASLAGVDPQALRGEHASAARTVLALSMFDDRDAAQRFAIGHDLLQADHPIFEAEADISTDQASLGRWPLSPGGRFWLDSLAGGKDVETVLLWVMTLRTGAQFGDADFDPFLLRRRSPIPLTTFAEMVGME